MSTLEHNTVHPAATHRFIGVAATVLVLLLGISAWANWYARNVSLPRYCENPAQTLSYLEQIIGDLATTGQAIYPEDSTFNERRPYLVAAKLLYLMPRESNESNAAYLSRIKQYLEGQCR